MATTASTAGDSSVTPISGNVAENIVSYVRSNTIRNEQQALLWVPSMATGYLDDPRYYVCVVGIGTPGGGKSHLLQQITHLWQQCEDDLYTVTGGTDKSIIYDENWNACKVAILNEINKLPDFMIEFLKSAHGDDEEFVYNYVTGSVKDGFETEQLTRKAKPYNFVFAQWARDMELWDRLLKIPVHESESKNRAVGRMAFGHDNISIGDERVEYGYDYYDGTERLWSHMATLSDAPGHVVLPDGSDRLGGWDVWEIVKPIFNHGRSEVNRIYDMVANLIRSWALLNHHNRDTVDITVDGEMAEALVAEPQDLANVLTCQPQLRATTHEIDRKKRAICEAIDTKGGEARQVEGIKDIRDFLKESDAPEVKESELDNIINDLEDNYLLDVRAGAGDSGKDVFEFLGWDELGYARVDENDRLFNGSGTFEQVIDPITGEPFLEAYTKIQSEYDTSAGNLFEASRSGGSVTGSSGTRRRTGSSGSDSSSGGGLSQFGVGSNDDDPAYDLDQLERTILNHARTAVDGERIRNLQDVPVGVFLGIIPPDNPDRTPSSIEGTPLDPDHDVWDQPDKDDTWVTTRKKARRQIKETVKDLISMGIIDFEEIHEKDGNTVVDATIAVGTDD